MNRSNSLKMRQERSGIRAMSVRLVVVVMHDGESDSGRLVVLVVMTEGRCGKGGCG